MNDDAQVKVISRLTIDTSLALKNVRELAKETGTTSKEIKRLAMEIEQSWKELDQARASDGNRVRQEERMWAQLARQKEMERRAEEARMRQEIRMFEQAEAAKERAAEKAAKAIEAANQRAVKNTLRELEKLEKRLSTVAEGLRKAGDPSQASLFDAHLASLRGLKDNPSEASIYLPGLKQMAADGEHAIASLTRHQREFAKAVAESEADERKLIASLIHRAEVEDQAEAKRVQQYLAQAKRDQAQAARQAEYENTLRAQLALRVAKEKEAAAVALPSLAAQAAALQARLKLEGIANLELKQQAALLRGNVEALQKEVALTGTLTDAQAALVRQYQAQAKTLNANISQAAATQHTQIGGSLMQMMGRRMEWFLAGQVFYGMQNAIRQTVNDVADIEMRMVQLDRVMEDPLYKTEQMRDAIFQLGQEFGFSFQEVQDIVLRWAQAGYDVKESLEATRASLLALNTAELNSEQATQSLIGIMAQWGLKADQLTTVIDKINKVADDYAVSSQDIVDGLLRSSGAARAANMTFEQTVALVTAMKEASGRTGKEVGNALNSVIAYIQRAKSLETLEGAGIPVFADAQTKKLRSTFDLLQDLAHNWDKLQGDTQQRLMEEAEAAGLFSEEMANASGALEEWTDLQRRDIAAAASGAYRRNYLLALLKNFSQVYDVLQTQEQALGYSRRENEKTMDTAIKQWAAFKAELQQLGVTLVEGTGIMARLQDLVQLLKFGVDTFNRLPTPIKNTLSLLAMLGAAMGLANLVTRQFFGVTLKEVYKMLITDMDKLKESIRSTIQSIMQMSTAGKIALGGVTAAALAVTAAVILWDRNVTKLQRTYEETSRALDSSIQAAAAEAKIHSQNALTVQKLADEYRALNKAREGGDQTAAVRQREILAQLKSMLDEETYARLEAAQVSEEASQRVVEAEQQKAKDIAKAIDAQTAKYRELVINQTQAALDELEVIEKWSEGWQIHYTVWEHLQRGFHLFVNDLKATWLKLQAWFDEQMGHFAVRMARLAEQFPWLFGDDAAKRFWDASDNFFNRMNDSREALKALRDDNAQYDQMFENKAKGRIMEHLATLRQKLLELNGGDKTPEPSDDGGQYGTGDADKGKGVSSTIDGIVAETEALGQLDDQTKQHIQLLQSRIAYNTREGATLEELRKADEDRAELTRLLTERQERLHAQAEAARAAYATLSEMQGKVNRSTEEGKKAYEEIGKAMDRMLGIAGDASYEWWNIERDKADLLRQNNAVSVETIRTLDDLREKYDNGVLSIDEYVAALGRLENQAGLTKEATKKLNEEQAKALKTQWSEQITNALKARKDEIEAGVKALEEAEKSFDALGKDDERNAARSSAFKAVEKLFGQTPTGAKMPSAEDIRSLLNTVSNQFSDLNLGDLSPEAFADVIGKDLAALRGFSTTAQGYLESVGDAAAERLAQIADELQAIDDQLQDRLDELQRELDALDEQDKQDEREKATGAHNQRLKKLRDDLLWAQLQNEEDAAFKIAKIKKDIADEERAFAEQQAEWEKQDKRSAIQRKMDEARQEAEIRRKALEEERKALQEQQAAMTEALNGIIQYIASEIAARKKALEGEKQELSDTSKELDETLKGVEGDVLSTLSFMAAQDPEFYKRAQSMMDNLIQGIRDKRGDLNDAVNEINRAIGRIGSGGSGSAPSTPPSSPPPPPPSTLPPVSRFRPMAEGAYVRAGRGGVLGWIGEGKHDEWVLPEPKLIRTIQAAMQRVTLTAPAFSMGDIGGVIGRSIREALQNVTLHGVINIAMPDGTIRREVIKIFSGFGQVLR